MSDAFEKVNNKTEKSCKEKKIRNFRIEHLYTIHLITNISRHITILKTLFIDIDAISEDELLRILSCNF